MPGFDSPQTLDEAYESILNRVIPNREPSLHTKYSATAKKLMLTEENNEQIVKNEHANLRTRLMELFAEQKNWKKQLQEIGENMSFDDVRNQIKQANEKIAKHQEIIVECEECEKKNGKDVSIMVPIEEADGEYTIADVVYDGYEPINEYYIYSIEHSRKRIAFWEGEIAKCEQKLQMMEIVQQQLTQVTQDIAAVNEQIKNATTVLTNEPLVEEQSNDIENVFIPENNRVSKEWIYTDKATSEDKDRFEKHIEYLCKNKISAYQIKRYIKEQEKDCILEHINFTKQYEILKEKGVDFQEKTFLNA